MLILSNLKHKKVLKQYFSDCFLPVKDDLGNVPVKMQSSKVITASIIGVCRGYADSRISQESDFEMIVDAVFEDIFRRESVKVQILTESWLKNNDEEFMKFYYLAKSKAEVSDNLNWLQEITLEYFKPEKTIIFPL